MIEEYKAAGRRSELQEAVRQLHNSFRMSKPFGTGGTLLADRGFP